VLQQPTIERLYALRLAVMAAAWQQQQTDTKIASLTFDERFAFLVDAEFIARQNKRVAMMLKQAELRIANACIEDVDASGPRGLDPAVLHQLATCTWIGDKLNVLVSGATGVGKSFVACALGQMACRRGLRVMYKRLPRLFEQLSLSKADGTYIRLLSKLAKLDLLIIDDLGIAPLKDAQRYDLLEVLEDRYGNTSTIIASQLPIDTWHRWLGDPTVADAILDRLVHNAFEISLKGPSRRKEKDKNKK
jgi:DNA replication protein DnaC